MASRACAHPNIGIEAGSRQVLGRMIIAADRVGAWRLLCRSLVRTHARTPASKVPRTCAIPVASPLAAAAIARPSCAWPMKEVWSRLTDCTNCSRRQGAWEARRAARILTRRKSSLRSSPRPSLASLWHWHWQQQWPLSQVAPVAPSGAVPPYQGKSATTSPPSQLLLSVALALSLLIQSSPLQPITAPPRPAFHLTATISNPPLFHPPVPSRTKKHSDKAQPSSSSSSSIFARPQALLPTLLQVYPRAVTKQLESP